MQTPTQYNLAEFHSIHDLHNSVMPAVIRFCENNPGLKAECAEFLASCIEFAIAPQEV